VKPGRFRPSCPKCGKGFLLTVAADGSMKVALPPGGGSDPNVTAPAAAADSNATAPPPAAAPTAKAKPAAAQQATEATGAWEPPAAKKPAPAAKPAAKPASRPAAKGVASPDATAPLPAPKPGPKAMSPEATGAWETPAGDAGERTEAFGTPAGSAGADAGDHTEVFEGGGDQDATVPRPVGDPERSDAATKGPAKSRAGSKVGSKKPPVEKNLPADAPASLGGYEIVKQLGKGGMGTVYLARQVSLDRHVALKTLNPEWASDPRFLTRFTREAYAAAQLTHHNILQIYDIGEEHGTPFFSMEFVEGSNLADLVQASGKMDVEGAVGYILQAARGLKYAHEQGMVHRDIKPANLMLNQHGIVKVADLGLVKTPQAVAAEEAAEQGTEAPEDANVTSVGVAMGTPTYMAPEQGLNAAGVDQRADIYSLGCTLYVLLTGQPPFKGKTAMEVMSKHQTEPIVRPEKLEKRVPAEVSDILLKMLAKKVEDRYQDLGEVITDLEKFLGVQTAGPFSPQQEHVDALEEAAKKFNTAPAAGLRSIIVPAFFGLCVVVAIICFLFGWPKVGAAALGMGLFTGVFSFLACGMANRNHLFQKTREFVLDNSWADWLTWVTAIGLFVAVSWLVGMLHWWVGVLVLAVGLAATYYALVDRSLANQRREVLDEGEKLLKSMRLKGVEEDALQQFVCKYAGQHWEEFYEALFGYDALTQARALWSRSATGRARPRFAPWREPILRWIDARQGARKAKKEKRLLMKLERKALEAQGMSASEAQALAEEAAEDMVEGAAELRAQPRLTDATVAPESGRAVRMSAGRLVRRINYGRGEEGGERPRRPRQPVKKLLEALFSPKVRFLGGAILLALCLMWASNNNLLSAKDLENATEGNFTDFLKRADEAAKKPLIGEPGSTLGSLFNSFNPGIAGLLLILAALLSDLPVIAVCIAGALVIFFGPLVPLPEGLPIDKTLLWAGGGVAVMVLSFVVGRFIK
jgi:serine/threonine protein kinase